jgi:hypothetical protein
MFYLIGQDYMSSSSRIIKASFHPMGSSHVVILMNGSLILIDISNPNGDTEFYPLGIKDHFVSYCFGPSIDWMKFSIFLLSDKKSDKAEVFCLCPVIPKDISVPKSSVRDLWAWIDEQVVFREEHNTSGEVYLERVRQYLTAAFGPRNILEKEDKIGKSASSFVLSRGSLYTETEALLFAAPSLQGPFSIAECGTENKNNWEVIPNKNDEKVKRKACDICTPRTRGEGAPLIAVSFDNGDVDFLVLGCEVGETE